MNITVLYIAASSILSASPSHGPGLPNGYIPVTSVMPVNLNGAYGNSMNVFANLSCDFGSEGASLVTTQQALAAYNVARHSWDNIPPPALLPIMQNGGQRLGKWNIPGLSPGVEYRLTLSGTSYWEGEGQPWNLTWEWVQPANVAR